MNEKLVHLFESPEQFFEDLGARRHEPLLGDASGTLRVELDDGGHKQEWNVTMKGGGVEVSREPQTADCIMRISREAFVAALRGEGNIIAAFLRGAVTVEGSAVLALQFQRLMPGPKSQIDMSAERRRTA